MLVETIKMRLFLGFLTVGVLAASLFAAAAQATGDPDEAIKYRQLVMRSNSLHIGAIAAILKGKVPYVGHIVFHARALRDDSLMYDDIFPTDSNLGLTRAKPEIWQQPEKFKAAVIAFQEASAVLLQAAESGVMGAVGAVVGAVGKSCGGCHNPFRAPKE